MIMRFGFMQEIDIPATLKLVENCGPKIKMMDTSFFLARQTLLASDRPGMAIWREKVFAWMLCIRESRWSSSSCRPTGSSSWEARSKSERGAPLAGQTRLTRLPRYCRNRAAGRVGILRRTRPTARRCRDASHTREDEQVCEVSAHDIYFPPARPARRTGPGAVFAE